MIHRILLLTLLALLPLQAAAQIAPGTYAVPQGSTLTTTPTGATLVVPAPLPPPDTTPPTMSGIGVPGATITTTTATVVLTTNEPARATVEYGPTNTYGSQAGPSASGTAHAIPLTGLTPATLYHYRVRAVDGAGNASAPSSDGSFQVQAPVTPPATGTGTWRKLFYNVQPYRPYYYHAFIIDKPGHADHGKVWMTWSGTSYLLTPDGGSAAVAPIATTPQMAWRENFGSDFDPTGGLGWMGPQASSPGPLDGAQVFDPVARTYTGVPAGGASNSVLAIDPARGFAYSFAGFNTQPLRRKPLVPLGAAWIDLNPANPLPPVITDGTQDGARLSSLRGGIDRRTGHLWFVGNFQELYDYDPDANRWTLIPTTGTKPPMATAFALHEEANTIVGYAGCSNLNDPCGTVINQTFLLDLATRTWRPGPTTAQPSVASLARYVPLYDRSQKRVIWLTGQDGLDAFEWKPSGAAASQPVALTVTKEGAGDGAVSGGGNYLPGAAVTLNAQPTAGSSFDGWAPAPCAPAFVMPAAPLTCRGTFSKVIATPPLEGFRFYAQALPPLVSGQPPVWAFSKDANTKDVPCDVIPATGRVLCGTGDFTGAGSSDSGRNEVFSYDPVTNLVETVSTYCHPVGQISPNHSSDKGPFWYRPLDHALYVSVELGFPDQAGQACNVGSPSGSIYTGGLLKLDLATRQWSSVGGVFGTKNIGHYDAARDSVLYVRHDECGGGALWSYAVAAKVSSKLADLCMIPAPAWTSSTAGFYRAALAGYLQNFAWDPATQTAYLIFTHGWIDASGNTTHREAFLWSWTRSTGTVRQLAKPPLSTPWGAGGAADYTIQATWVPGVGVAWPVVRDPCGRVEKMLVYQPGTDQWLEAPLVGDVTQDIRGTSQIYVPGQGLLLAGSVFCTGGNQQHAFIWRP